MMENILLITYALRFVIGQLGFYSSVWTTRTTWTTFVEHIFVDSHRILVKESIKGNTVILHLHIFNLSCCIQ